MAELVDAKDSKSFDRKVMRVRFSPAALVQKVIAIVGPTASGKSSLGIYLAKKLKGEVISADSRQVYRGMEIISRAPNKQDKASVPHHLVGIANPKKQYSAGTYAQEAERVIAALASKHKIPIVVGGAGFYTDALLREKRPPEVPPNKKLRATLAKKTPAQLLALLKKIDPASATRVDQRNIVRLVRAIEIAQALGKVPALKTQSSYEILWLGLLPTKKIHASAIQKGIEERLAAGMVREVKQLRARLTKKRFTELGFEFELLAAYLDKEMSKKELAEKLAQGEQRYAIRQMRWFKRNPDIHWVHNKSEAAKLSKTFLS